MKIKNRISSILLICFGLIIMGVTSVKALYYDPQEEIPLEMVGVSFSSDDVNQNRHPKQIIIPRIGVEANIEEVGITYKGNMSTPKKVSNTGWYKYGTIPGYIGSAVVDGHVDNGLGLPGVFNDLKNLYIGDDVYIVTKQGDKLHFKVTSVKSYHYDKVPKDTLFNKSDGAYLNLITCDGKWLPEKGTAERRIVVYTKLVSVESITQAS